MYCNPLIFDINRSSVSDGPGIRTTVFLKGCNLDCYWCHNPEGKSAARQSAFFEEKCLRCGACVNDASLCPVGARRSYGNEYSARELFDIIKKDIEYYKASGGGVTFSGGECMLYPEFVAEVAALCKGASIHVAVDTAGNVPYSSFVTVLPYTDMFLYDIKCLDPELHKKGTGVSNVLILENLERLIDTGKDIIIRTPVLEGFNAGEQQAIQKYCADRGLLWQALPYHAFGENKKKALI